jgi:hypothetical protein
MRQAPSIFPLYLVKFDAVILVKRKMCTDWGFSLYFLNRLVLCKISVAELAFHLRQRTGDRVAETENIAVGSLNRL